MGSTFFGLTIASSALSAFQASTNTVANNISNVQTAGYSRQVANLGTSTPIRVSEKYGTMGTGVSANSITQYRDSYYDTKYWRNQPNVGLYETRLYYMEQVETIFADDDAATGFSTIYSKLFNDMDTLKNNSGDPNARNQFISGAQNLTSYFNGIATQLNKMQTDLNNEVKSTVDQVNAIAQKIALLNKQINGIEIQGGHANELRDQRALLVDELSAIVPVEVEEYEVMNSNFPDQYTGATNYRIKICGQNLVDTFEYHELAYSARKNKINQTDVDGLYDLTWKDTGVSFDPTSSAMSGTLRALFEMRDGNNKSVFSGTTATGNSAYGSAVVNGRNVSTITITDPSVTSVEKLNIAQSGILTIRNNNYNYSDFTMNQEPVLDGNGDPVLDAKGNPTYTYSYTFTLERELNSLEKGKLAGQSATIGNSIDAMGIPYYQAQMSEFLRVFAGSFNALQQGTAEDPGMTLGGEEMGAFFVANNKVNGEEYDFSGTTISSFSSTYYQLTAASFGVANASVRDSSRIATTSKSNYNGGVDSYEIIEKTLKLQSETKVYRGCGADDFLQCLLSDITVDTQESSLFRSNYVNIANTIDTQRQSISGVDEDEEALDLIKFQNAYNLASKMISVMSEMYDRLITQTGV